MSQNGPPWSRGGSEEPYAEPADPWGDQGTPDSSANWGGHPPSIPHQPMSYHSAPISGGSVWGPHSAPPRRNTPILALVVALGLLIVAGLGTAFWLLNEQRERPPTGQGSSASPTPAAPGAPLSSADARFYVKVGDCVVNEGTDTQPKMRTSACATGSYKVLQKVKGKTTGKKDAESKCAKVTGYTKWYFFDSPMDDFDFVLCLKEHRPL